MIERCIRPFWRGHRPRKVFPSELQVHSLASVRPLVGFVLCCGYQEFVLSIRALGLSLYDLVDMLVPIPEFNKSFRWKSVYVRNSNIKERESILYQNCEKKPEHNIIRILAHFMMNAYKYSWNDLKWVHLKIFSSKIWKFEKKKLDK